MSHMQSVAVQLSNWHLKLESMVTDCNLVVQRS
jgi:hypothetical protein